MVLLLPLPDPKTLERTMDNTINPMMTTTTVAMECVGWGGASARADRAPLIRPGLNPGISLREHPCHPRLCLAIALQASPPSFTVP